MWAADRGSDGSRSGQQRARARESHQAWTVDGKSNGSPWIASAEFENARGIWGCCGPSIQRRWTAHEVVRTFTALTAVDLTSNGWQRIGRSRFEQETLTSGARCQWVRERAEVITHVNSTAVPPVSESRPWGL